MSRRSRKWNLSSLDSVAGKSRTGTETRPNEMAPDQIGRGTPGVFHSRRVGNRARFQSREAGTQGGRASPPDGGLGARGPPFGGPRRVEDRDLPVENPVDDV